ncbi:hypothetical protein KPH14_001056 [Odynerus spinipes]|uniref:Uncharacterized protein n=1 Tax=Odynerus spinipes TaxID=1348599 RepID=A0AAD9VI05_9HYME|nr:hypothetical protein KPH14_001056 [Odynerus spinipes]
MCRRVTYEKQPNTQLRLAILNADLATMACLRRFALTNFRGWIMCPRCFEDKNYPSGYRMEILHALTNGETFSTSCSFCHYNWPPKVRRASECLECRMAYFTYRPHPSSSDVHENIFIVHRE